MAPACLTHALLAGGFAEDGGDGAGDFGVFGVDALLNLFDAGHDGGVVSGEDGADFFEGDAELRSAEVHGDLAGEGAVSAL